jgi:hypothetical protein
MAHLQKGSPRCSKIGCTQLLTEFAMKEERGAFQVQILGAAGTVTGAKDLIRICILHSCLKKPMRFL